MRRGRDISIDLEISFREGIFGTERRVILTKVNSCADCHGKGAKPGSTLKTCASCNGKGRLQETRRSFLGMFTAERMCETCAGAGKVPEMPCAGCGGVGVRRESGEVVIVVPPGVESGQMIKLPGEGEAVARGSAGDLYVKLSVEEDRRYKREGKNLIMELEVKLTDALLGAEYSTPTLDGDLKVTIPAGVSSGEVLRARGKGIPIDGDKNKRGDLLIEILVKTPAKLSHRAKELVEELKREGV